MPHVNNPYIDFKYGENYASDFHLLRVSNGSRFNNNLIPTLTDKTAETPGADGMFFFNTYYKQRQFTVDVAYEAVTEQDIRNIRNWLNGKDIRDLIFDEQPDRCYKAKVTGSPSLKFIPFDQLRNEKSSTNIEEGFSSDAEVDETVVIYKGEGSIQFTCYDPYAYSLKGKGWHYTPGQSSTNKDVTVEGTAPSFFKVLSIQENIASGTVISVKDGDNILYQITLEENVDSINWNSRTGIVKGRIGNNERPIKFTGNSMGVLDIGVTPKIEVTANSALDWTASIRIIFYDRYL